MMAFKLRAIETEYDGRLFRSRLEARWAVFFNSLGIPYEYEKEGFELGDAGRYLPDFWLPEQDCWVEIKPKYKESYNLKCSRLAELSNQTVIIIFGEPYPEKYLLHVYYGRKSCEEETKQNCEEIHCNECNWLSDEGRGFFRFALEERRDLSAVSRFIQFLEKRDCRFTACSDGRLKTNSPPGVMTEEIRRVIRENKEKILFLLKRRNNKELWIADESFYWVCLNPLRKNGFTSPDPESLMKAFREATQARFEKFNK